MAQTCKSNELQKSKAWKLGSNAYLHTPLPSLTYSKFSFPLPDKEKWLFQQTEHLKTPEVL